MTSPALHTREMSFLETEAVAELSAQLGYPSDAAEVAKRFLSLQQSSNDGLFVAVQAASVIGWLHVYGVKLLESDGYAEIGGVVVDVAARRHGIGRQLIRCAERWAVAHGYSELRLRSGLHRLDAHKFYQFIGYKLTKTSHMFYKRLV